MYFCVNFWAICQNSVQASFLPAEHILQTFYFCCCHSRFAFRQHRTIPALRLKHRFGGCGTASALPKCSIMSGCGTRIVLRGQKPLALCDRCPCFGSLFPPLAALTFAASSIICAFGLASAAPRSPYRHLELCGIAFILSKQNSGSSLVGKAAASDNPLSCVLFHLRGAISSFCAAYRITFYLRQSAGRYNRSVLLLRQPTLYHPC